MADSNKSGGMKLGLILGGCGCLTLFILTLVGIGGLFFFQARKDVKVEESKVQIIIEQPARLEPGAIAELKVVLDNAAGRQPQELSEVDLPLSYLKGLEVLSVEPEPLEIIENEPFEPTRSYRFNRQVSPGGRFEVVLKLKALEAGVYSGELGIQRGNQRTMHPIESKIGQAPTPAEVFVTPPEPAQ